MSRKAIRRGSSHAAWIHLLDDAALARYLDRLETLDPATHPLWGVPFAIKDNIDLAGCPHHGGMSGLFVRPPGIRDCRGPVAGGGCGSPRQDQSRSVRHGLGGHAFALRRDAQRCRSRLHRPGEAAAGRRWRVKLGMCSFALGTDTAGVRTASGGLQWTGRLQEPSFGLVVGAGRGARLSYPRLRFGLRPVRRGRALCRRRGRRFRLRRCVCPADRFRRLRCFATPRRGDRPGTHIRLRRGPSRGLPDLSRVGAGHPRGRNRSGPSF